MQIRHAVFPVAGLGVRFLPFTKATPKEMLPLVDKPLIQYAVEEAVRAGIKHMIFVTNSKKHTIANHFNDNIHLERHLSDQGNDVSLALLQTICSPDVQFTFIRQNKPLGLGDAVLCAEHVVGIEPFVVILPDNLLGYAEPSCLVALNERFTKHNQSLVAVQCVPWNEIHNYGIVNAADLEKNDSLILDIIEKPNKSQATSNLASIGRYLFTSSIFSYIKQTPVDKNGEIQLTDAIQQLLKHEKIYAYKYSGEHFDCGSKLGYLQAVVKFGMQHPEVGEDFRAYLKHSQF